MRISVLALLVVACTPLGNEDWPAQEQLEHQAVEAQTVVPGQCAAAPPPTKLPLHRDVALELRYRGQPILEPGLFVEVDARLKNQSTERGHRVVLPGDGSEVAWREPHVWYSAFVDTGDGCWQPVPELEMARCGMFDHEWRDDIVELGPGQSRKLEWLGNPSYMLDLQRAGTVRLFLHYAYRAGATGKGQDPRASTPPESAEGIAAFELTSNPVELRIERPLDLELVPKPNIPRSITRMSDGVDVRVRNVGERARSVERPSSSRLSFEIRGTENSYARAEYHADEDRRRPVRLRSGDTLELIGRQSPVFSWTHTVRERVRVRATYRPYDEPAGAQVRSEWVQVDLRSATH